MSDLVKNIIYFCIAHLNPRPAGPACMRNRSAGCMAAPAYMRIRRYRILVIQIYRPIKINVLSMFGLVAIGNGKNVLPLYRTLLLVLQVSHVTFSEISAADQDGKLLATNWDVFQRFKRRF